MNISVIDTFGYMIGIIIMLTGNCILSAKEYDLKIIRRFPAWYKDLETFLIVSGAIAVLIILLQNRYGFWIGVLFGFTHFIAVYALMYIKLRRMGYKNYNALYNAIEYKTLYPVSEEEIDEELHK